LHSPLLSFNCHVVLLSSNDSLSQCCETFVHNEKVETCFHLLWQNLEQKLISQTKTISISNISWNYITGISCSWNINDGLALVIQNLISWNQNINGIFMSQIANWNFQSLQSRFHWNINRLNLTHSCIGERSSDHNFLSIFEGRKFWSSLDEKHRDFKGRVWIYLGIGMFVFAETE
jgi:hypothetical protein